MIWFRIGLILAIVAACGGVYLRMVYLEDRNEKLTSELEKANITIIALDGLAKEHGQIRKTEKGLIDEIEAAPPEDDAPTAPVLLNAIERLH